MTKLLSVIAKPVKQIFQAAIFLLVVEQVVKFLSRNLFSTEEPVQKLWARILQLFGNSSWTYHVWGSTIITNFVFFVFGSIFMIFDLTGRPRALRKYKIQESSNEPLEWNRFLKLMKQIVWNQLTVGIFFNVTIYWLSGLRGTEPHLENLPSALDIIFQIPIFLAVEEVFFYYSHLLMHRNRFLYRVIHKRHHEWQATVAYAAIYAHPIEHFVSNLLPAGLGPLLCGSHVTTTWLWYTVVILNTLNSHSGYHLPFLPSPEGHDFHHLKYNQCFGVVGVLDFIHGTDDIFRTSQAFKRHCTLITFRSAKEIFPDD